MTASSPLTTDRQVAGLRAALRPYEVSVPGARGLVVRVFPTGTKSFEFRYVAMGGQRRRFPLGNYPGLSLAAARDDAQRLGVEVKRGADPAAERAAARLAARTGDTVSELAEAYFTAAAKGLHGGRGRPKRPLTLKVEKNRFDRHLAPLLGDTRFAEVRRSDVKTAMRTLAARGTLAADTVASIGGTLSNILAFAVYEERLEANPALGLTRPLALRTRDRMLDDSALAILWDALSAVSAKADAPPTVGKPNNAAKADKVVALALRFAMLTLARRNDVASARWSEIDPDRATWTIPAARFKGGRVHVVPLSPQALEVLSVAAELPGSGGDVVFPSPSHPVPTAEKPPRHIVPSAMTRALARTLAVLGLPHGSPHDFRRAGATTLTGEAHSVRRFIVGKVLGHSVQDGAAVTSVYDRNEYLSDKRAALNAWGRHLDGDIAAGSNIVRIAAGA